MPSLGRLGTHSPRALHLPRYSLARISTTAPRISVVIPSYNQGHFIRETLLSLLNENYPNLELIVVDGGSKDETVSILQEFDSCIAWWISEPDTGQVNAINKGFQRSTGEIMAWLNSDDRIVPGALHLIAHFFITNPDVDVVYGNRILIDEHEMEIGRWVLPFHSSKILKWVDFIPQETMYWRRRAWEKIGSRLDESFQFAMDWDLLLRFSNKNLRFKHLSKYLGLFRVHKAQKTSKDIASVGRKEIENLRRRELGFSPTRGQLVWNSALFLLMAKLNEVFDRFRSHFSRPA